MTQYEQYEGWLDPDEEDVIQYREYVPGVDEKGGYSKWSPHPRANVMTKGERMHHRARQGISRTSIHKMEQFSELWRRHYSKDKGTGWSPPGKKGKDIKALQSRLERLGYDLGPTGVDKTWGEYTDSAYKSYKEDWDEGYSMKEIFQKNIKKPKGIVKELEERSQPGAARWEDAIIDDMKKY